MSTFLMILLSVILVIGGLIFFGLMWLKAKAQKGIALLAATAVSAALQSMKTHQAKPENAGDTQLADLIARFEEGDEKARAAFKSGNYEGVMTIAEPLMADFAAYKKVMAEKQAAQQQANSGTVIDAEVVEAPKELQAPEAKPADPASNPPAADSAPDADKKN